MNEKHDAPESATPALAPATPVQPPSPKLPDPANYGWSDGIIRNTYSAELYLDVADNAAGEAALPEWLSLRQDYTIEIHARGFEEARELVKKAPAALLRGLGIPDVKEDTEAADGATVQCFFNGALELKTARVLTEEDVFELFGDVPLHFANHYKQTWGYAGKKDHYQLEFVEVDTDYRYSVEVGQPITINERCSAAGVTIVDERCNLIVYQGKEIFR